MSGFQKDSQIPRRDSGAVPATMKSLAVSMAPMLSVPARYTDPSASNPAITGCAKYGPNLHPQRHCAGSAALILLWSLLGRFYKHPPPPPPPPPHTHTQCATMPACALPTRAGC